MRIARPVLCLALVGSLTAVGAASAATKPKPKPVPPVCNLVVDPAGDATIPGDDSLDIIGADIASDAKSFTAVIRLKNVSAQGMGQLGSQIQMQFELSGAEAPVWMDYSTSAYGGKIFQYGLIGMGEAGVTSPTGVATGIVDAAKNEVRITVPTGDMSALGKAKPGSKVSNLTASASQLVGVAPNATGIYGHNSQVVDDAVGSKAYTAGAKSCVTPGK